MPLSALLGHEPLELASIGSTPSVLPQHTVLVGIRNLDRREKDHIRASGVHVFTMKDIDRDGIATVANARWRLRRATPAAFTFPSTWMFAIRQLRLASERRSREASITVKHT